MTAFQDANVRSLALSRAAAKLSIAIISYGSMVYLATEGASQFEISLVSASTYFSAVLFGVQGGVLADSLSKRFAIIAGYITLAVLSIVIPFVFGTGVTELIAMMFIAGAMMQVISPSLKAIVALVSTPRDMATVSVSVSVAGSIASAIGSSFVAPAVIKFASIDLLFVIAACVMLFGAYRTVKLPKLEAGRTLRQAASEVDWIPRTLSVKYIGTWIMNNPGVSTIVLLGAMVVAIFEAFNTLIPVYVRDVLDANPANAIYIFAPAGIGFLIGMFTTPTLIHKIGQRRLAIVSISIMSVSMILFGLIDQVAPLLAPISPLRLLGWIFSVEINELVLAASLIALPANYGSTAASAAVQNYINARVPVEKQGAIFGMQEVKENIVTLVLVLALGTISTFTGPKIVFIVAPIVVFGVVIALLRYSHRMIGGESITTREAWDSLMDSDEEPSQH